MRIAVWSACSLQSIQLGVKLSRPRFTCEEFLESSNDSARCCAILGGRMFEHTQYMPIREPLGHRHSRIQLTCEKFTSLLSIVDALARSRSNDTWTADLLSIGPYCSQSVPSVHRCSIESLSVITPDDKVVKQARTINFPAAMLTAKPLIP